MRRKLANGRTNCRRSGSFTGNALRTDPFLHRLNGTLQEPCLTATAPLPRDQVGDGKADRPVSPPFKRYVTGTLWRSKCGPTRHRDGQPGRRGAPGGRLRRYSRSSGWMVSGMGKSRRPGDSPCLSVIPALPLPEESAPSILRDSRPLQGHLGWRETRLISDKTSELHEPRSLSPCRNLSPPRSKTRHRRHRRTSSPPRPFPSTTKTSTNG